MKEARHRISDKWNDEKPALNELQSQEILMGLTSGVDVSLYADPRYTFKEMEKIRLALERGSNLDGLLKYGCQDAAITVQCFDNEWIRHSERGEQHEQYRNS